MSTSSVMDNSISQSLSLSSGYQSFIEDSSIIDNPPNASTSESSDNSVLSTNATPNQVSNRMSTGQHSASINNQTDKIKLRNQPTQLKLTNQRTKRYSCNLSSFGNYDQPNDKFMTQINKDKINQINHKLGNHLNSQTNGQLNGESNSQSTGFNHQTVTKQLPNSTSNVEISLNTNKQWESKMIKTYSTNAFNGKDTIYNNNKNVQRNSNSFLNLSERVNIGSLDLNFLIKKKKDKKKKKEYQFCMLVFGGNEKFPNGVFSKQPISVYKLYI